MNWLAPAQLCSLVLPATNHVFNTLQKNVRNPNHYFSKEHMAIHLPICSAIRLQFILQSFRCPYALRKGEYCQYSSPLYRNTPQEKPVLQRRARAPKPFPEFYRISGVLQGSAEPFCLVESLLEKPHTEPKRFCRTLAAKQSFSDPANSSPDDHRRVLSR